MAITTPNDYVPIGPEDFALVSMPGALGTILENTNYLYRYHRPAMLSVAYTSAFEITGRTARFTIPVKQSADALIYEFRSKVLATGAVAWNLTVLIETYDAVNGWQNLTTATTAQAIMANTAVTDVQTGILQPAVTMIRVSYTGNNGAKLTPHHLLVIPTPGAVVTGIKASGFVPYDDGFLSSTGAVTTEHVNRAQANATAILRDRAQCVLAFVQEDTPANMVLRPGLAQFTQWRSSPSVRVGLYGQAGTITLDCAILAGVTRGAGKVRAYQTKAPTSDAYFEANADGTLHTGTMAVTAYEGGGDGGVDLAVQLLLTDALAVADIYAVMCWWRPTT